MKKKLLIAVGVLFALLLAVTLLVPLLFEDRVREGILGAANDKLDADLALGDLSLSLVRDFPSVTVRLSEVTITGRAEHEGTALLALERLDVAVDITSVFGKIELEEITLVRPVLTLARGEGERPNWQITKPNDPETEEPGGDMPSLALEQVTIRDGAVSFDDAQTGVAVTLDELSFGGRADLAAERSRADVELVIGALGLVQKGRTLLEGSRLVVELEADVDQAAGLLTIAENQIELDSLALGAAGTITLPADGLNVLDLKLAADTPSIASLISLVPGLADGALDGMTTDGVLSLTGFARGPVGGEALPAFGVDLSVVDGSYSHAALAVPLTDIQVAARIDGPGPGLDAVVVDIERASAKLAGNPLSVTGRASKPLSDLLVDVEARGDLDLAQLGALVPRDHAAALTGDVDLDIRWSGSVRRLTDQDYMAKRAEGTVRVADASWSPEGATVPVLVPTASMRLTPATVRVEELTVQAGGTDLRGTGQLDNVLAWALLAEDLVGTVRTRSRTIDLDELTTAFGADVGRDDGESEDGRTPPVAPGQRAALRLPAGIDLTLKSNADSVVFRGIAMEDAQVRARVVDQALRFEDVSVGMLDGRVGLTGTYDSGPARPLVDVGIELTRVDITSLLEAYPVAEKLAPVARKAVGRISTELSLDGQLDEAMQLVLDSLDGQGKLVAHTLRIEGSEALDAIGAGLKNARFRRAELEGVTALFSVEAGRIEVQPFALKIGPIDATLGGAHHFDQDIDYDLDLLLPAGEFSGKAASALGSLSRGTPFAGVRPKLGDTVQVGADITGTVMKPIVTLDLRSLAANAGDVLKDVAEQALDEATKQVEDVVDQGLERARAQAEAARSSAYAAADRVKELAYEAADAAKTQAHRAADRLVRSASDPISKLTAKAAAAEAKKEADRALADAKKRADRTWRDAKKEADAQYEAGIEEASKGAKEAPSKARTKVRRKGK